jgi:hypothetical protein
MRQARRTIALAIATLAAPVATAMAHHSFAIYDFSQRIPFEGVVDTLNFKNPHIAMTLSHVDENGETVIIDFVEGAPANMLARLGLRPAMLAPGTKVTAIGSPLKSDPTQYFLRSVILEDGREFDATRNATR